MRISVLSLASLLCLALTVAATGLPGDCELVVIHPHGNPCTALEDGLGTLEAPSDNEVETQVFSNMEMDYGYGPLNLLEVDLLLGSSMTGRLSFRLMDQETKRQTSLMIKSFGQSRIDVFVKDGRLVDVEKIQLYIPQPPFCSECVLITRFDGSSTNECEATRFMACSNVNTKSAVLRRVKRGGFIPTSTTPVPSSSTATVPSSSTATVPSSSTATVPSSSTATVPSSSTSSGTSRSTATVTFSSTSTRSTGTTAATPKPPKPPHPKPDPFGSVFGIILLTVLLTFMAGGLGGGKIGYAPAYSYYQPVYSPPYKGGVQPYSHYNSKGYSYGASLALPPVYHTHWNK